MKKNPSLLCLFYLTKKYNYNIVPSMRFKKSKSNLNLSWIINNNCKWLLCISHPELFTITVPLTLPAQPSSVPPALHWTSSMLPSLLSCWITATLSIRPLFLLNLFLVVVFLVAAFLVALLSHFQWPWLLLSWRLASGFEETLFWGRFLKGKITLFQG